MAWLIADKKGHGFSALSILYRSLFMYTYCFFLMKKGLLGDVGKSCPRCGKKLHVGIHHGSETDEVEYCKDCGFRNEIEV